MPFVYFPCYHNFENDNVKYILENIIEFNKSSGIVEYNFILSGYPIMIYSCNKLLKSTPKKIITKYNSVIICGINYVDFEYISNYFENKNIVVYPEEMFYDINGKTKHISYVDLFNYDFHELLRGDIYNGKINLADINMWKN